MNPSTSSSRRVLALDIGTSGARAAVFEPSGSVSATAGIAYSATYQANGFVEIDALEIAAGCVRVMRDCLRKSGPVDLVSLGSFMHSLVLVDDDFTPLTPLSIWADRRAVPQCEQVRPEYLSDDWRGRTGCPLSPSYPVYRLLWYRENARALFGSFRFALSIKSFLTLHLFGIPIEDCSIASGSGLWNLRDFDWDRRISDFVGLEADRLPRALPGNHAFVVPPTPSELLLNAAGRDGDLGQLAGAAVWLPGGADGPLAHLAGAGLSSDTASLSIGTSMAARIGIDMDGDRRTSDTWCYAMDEENLILGMASNNGGNALEWYARKINAGGVPTDPAAIESAPGAPEIKCIPELNEERGLDQATGGYSMIGVRQKHTSEQRMRGVVEGLAFQAADMLERLGRDHEIKRVVLSGSLTESLIIQEILASILEMELYRAPGGNASLEGARMIALGESQPPEENVERIRPAGGEVRDYGAEFERWKHLRDAIRKTIE